MVQLLSLVLAAAFLAFKLGVSVEGRPLLHESALQRLHHRMAGVDTRLFRLCQLNVPGVGQKSLAVPKIHEFEGAHICNGQFWQPEIVVIMLHYIKQGSTVRCGC